MRDVTASGRRPNRDEVERRRERGEQAAREGLALRESTGHHLAAVRAAWPEQLLSRRTTLGLLMVVEQSVDAFADGFERAQRLTVRQEEAESDVVPGGLPCTLCPPVPVRLGTSSGGPCETERSRGTGALWDQH
ncbi:hypothetical protein ACH4F6_30980 [Streptomyces sp. NPDC017936]|uniref:hypothetical protein n=1 Tax=Streptomyces sp. NPDC017936 TaxID=3365016 RepID=UPI0037B13746